MLTRTKENKGSFSNQFPEGKNICISFGGHQLELIEDLIFLPTLSASIVLNGLEENCEEKMKLQDQNPNWNNLFGVK